MHHRRDLDGLRAVAVLPVILFHAGYDVFSGGFLGVDVFFVLSGFLITGILLRELDTGTFSLLNFYERRARRILPALFLVILVCIPFAWHLMVPYQLLDFAQSLLAVLFFISNILFWGESGYFEAEAEDKPLLHTWSLAVEEQFYLFFPIFLILLWRLGRQHLNWFLAVTIVSSLALSEFWSRMFSDANFYFTITRAWELLFGAIAASYLNRRPSKSHSLYSATGFLMLFISFLWFDETTRLPGLYALVPVIGTLLIILFSGPGTLVGTLLSSRVLVGIGLISYSAYLWHQPILVFTHMHLAGQTPIWLPFGILLLTLLFATVSWSFIEQPFRNRTRISRKFLVNSLSAGAVAIGGIGIAGMATHGFYDLKVRSFPAARAQFIFDRDLEKRKSDEQWAQNFNAAETPFNDSSKQHVLILGDSVSIDTYMALILDKHYDNTEFRRLELDNGCIQAASQYLISGIDDDQKCTSTIHQLIGSSLLENADEVVIHDMWLEEDHHTLAEFTAQLIQLNKKVSIMGLLTFRDVASLSLNRNTPADQLPHYFYTNLREEQMQINPSLKAFARANNQVRFLNVKDFFCDDHYQVCQIYSSDFKPYIWDQHHMTTQGRQQLGQFILNAKWFE